MKTLPFSEILAETCQLIGLDRTTLNDKSFNAIRDFANRRIRMIWDREEWPDIQELVRLWPGVPITTAISYPVSLTTEVPADLLQENGIDILVQNAQNTVPMTVTLNANVPRIYLADFEDAAWQKGTIPQTFVNFINPFYILQDGKLVSIGGTQYNFAYSTATDSVGPYITQITINAPDGVPQFTSLSGTTLQFMSNRQPMAVVRGQAIGCWSSNPNQTSRKIEQNFTVENMPNLQNAQVLQQELNVLRFSNFDQKWVLLRRVAPYLFGTRYDAASGYAAGSQVYYDVSQGSSAYNPPTKSLPVAGQFWNAITGVPGSAPPANPSSYWEMVAVPFRFKGYVVNSVAADFMRSEGRPDEADRLDTLAEAAVQQQIDVLIRQQGQVQRMNMIYSY